MIGTSLVKPGNQIMKNIASALLIFVGCCSAQVENPPAKFPSDNQDPRKGGAFELLQVACPGFATGGDDMGCNDPSLSGKLLVGSVLGGHFLSPSSEDAILWMGGRYWKTGIPYLLSWKAGK
jgi:hypothetical protein